MCVFILLSSIKEMNWHKHLIFFFLWSQQKNEGERQYGAEEFLVPFSTNSATMEEKEDCDIDGKYYGSVHCIIILLPRIGALWSHFSLRVMGKLYLDGLVNVWMCQKCVPGC